jgi:hypothetical protein
MKLSVVPAAFTIAAVLVMTTAAAPRAAAIGFDKSITLSGCLIKGEGDGAGYLLISHAFDPAAASAGATHVTPGTIGTTGDFANMFYWLDGNGDLRKHVGHQVEIDGDAKGDVKEGEMKIERKDGWTELTVKSNGRTMNARVPHASIVESPNSHRKMDVLVRKVDVEHVRMLGADCR